MKLNYFNENTTTYTNVNVKKNKIHMITFNTEGNDIDNGLDLTNTSELFKQKYINHVDIFKSFNTTELSKKYPNFKEHYLPTYPEYNNIPEHSRGNNMGFLKWKPFIIYNYLKTMEDDDILVYHDCNIDKYSIYAIGLESFRNNVYNLFNKINEPVIAAFENPYNNNLICKNYVKEDVFLRLGEQTDYYYNYPLLHANRIFIKKNKVSVNFILNWLKLCKTELILPYNTILHNNNNRSWHTHDQAIFSILYRKYIDLGIFSNNAPNVYFKNGMFSTNNILFIS
jgi:hypothetical protein